MRLFFPLALLFILSACQSTPSEPSETQVAELNPAAEGFNLADSDAEAIALADSVMLAMGGRNKWDKSRYFHWTFFNRRSLLWDKQTGDVKITMLPDSTTILALNLFSGEGKAKVEGNLITEPDSLSTLMEQGKSIWINDAYWVFMPFKLKDSGVTLKYMGKDSTEANEPASLLQLTFQDVGDTPDNKYLVWVDDRDYLVRQWAFFPKFQDSIPSFVIPWQQYEDYNGLLLSGDRGDYKITNILVPEAVPESAFKLE